MAEISTQNVPSQITQKPRKDLELRSQNDKNCVGVIRDGMEKRQGKIAAGTEKTRSRGEFATLDLGLIFTRSVCPLGTQSSSLPSFAGQNRERPPPVPNPDYEVMRGRMGEGSF